MYVIYGQPNCIWCERAKELLDSLIIPYEYYNIVYNREAQWEFVERFPGRKTVPAIVKLTPNDGDHECMVIGGYEDLVRYLNM